MKKNYYNFKYNKNRALLTDVLPYETPILFTNLNLYNFVNNYLFETDNNNLKVSKFKKKDMLFSEAEKNIFSLLFSKVEVNTDKTELLVLDTKQTKIPFQIEIKHKVSDFRCLSIPHPFSQILVVDFYNNYKSLIIKKCQESKFSIRKPTKVANSIYYKDVLNSKIDKKDETSIIEIDGKESENLKSFFTVKSYSNIYKFYESYVYHRCEKKYNYLLKFDIANCFDSIYTHSICWAEFNKEIIKENLKISKMTFGGRFDELMQNLNYSETNGIIIGPEFSRIFAEVILQRIDKNIYQKLKSKEENKIYKKDYEIYRYIDDYFIFFDDCKIKDDILNLYKLELKQFNFKINDSKTKLYEKPLITEITIGKSAISDFLNNLFNEKKKEDDSPTRLYLNPAYLITKYKIIVKSSAVNYKDVVNYTLSGLGKELEKKITNPNYEANSLCSAVVNFLDLSFFIYNTSLRVNSTIKICMILSSIIIFVRSNSSLSDIHNNSIKKKIFDEISDVLKKCSSSNNIETMYLIIFLRELGRDYLLEPEVLTTYFKIDCENVSNDNLNYFSIITLLHYIKNNNRYNELRIYLKEIILNKYFRDRSWYNKSCEHTMLFFDLISCPYLEYEFKKELFGKYDIKDDNLCKKTISFQRNWFTKWQNFNAIEEILRKKSKEVY